MTLKENIYQTLTERYKQDFRDLINKKAHPTLCNCWLCLWWQYEKRPLPKGGRKYDLVTFLVYSLIHDVKLAYLIEKGIAKREVGQDYKGWSFPHGALNKAPYVNRVREILKEMPGFSEYTRDYLKTYADYKFDLYVERKRYQRDKLFVLLDELEYEIYFDQKKPESKKRGRRPKHKFKLIQDVADFIYSQPNKEAPRRRILRRFTTMRKEDLKGIRDWLKYNYDIHIKREGKSIVYYGKMENSRGKFWTVGVST